MGLLALMRGAGSMIGPLLGGLLNDNFNPRRSGMAVEQQVFLVQLYF